MKTIARVYDTYGQARQVVADLEASGVAASDINLIANKYVCDESARLHEQSAAAPAAGVGAALGGTAGLLAGLGIIAIPASVRSWRRVRWLRPRSAPLPAPRPAAWWALWSSPACPNPRPRSTARRCAAAAPW